MLTLEQRKERLDKLAEDRVNNAFSIGQELFETRRDHFEQVPGRGVARWRRKDSAELWEDWVKKNTHWKSEKTISAFIRAYRESGQTQLKQPLLQLPPTILRQLVSIPELLDAAAEILEEEGEGKIGAAAAKNATNITFKMAEQAKKELNEKKAAGEVVSFAVAKQALQKQQAHATASKLSHGIAKEKKRKVKAKQTRTEAIKECHKLGNSIGIYWKAMEKLMLAYDIRPSEIGSWTQINALVATAMMKVKKRSA